MEFIDDKSQLIKKPKTTLISSRGTGAGGENTNINGLSYEELTNLETECVIESVNKFHLYTHLYQEDNSYYNNPSY